MTSDTHYDDYARRALADLAADQAGPILERAEDAASKAPDGMKSEAYAAVLLATGIEPDMTAIRRTFGE